MRNPARVKGVSEPRRKGLSRGLETTAPPRGETLLEVAALKMDTQKTSKPTASPEKIRSAHTAL